MSTVQSELLPRRETARGSRLGFLGVGWIGRARMHAVTATGAAQAAVIADPSADCLREAQALVPDARVTTSLDALLEHELDGIVIATPSGLHAEQALQVLQAGLPVFCQKPLGRTAEETRRVIDAARTADLLLGVDLSYRHTTAMQAVRAAVASGAVGDVFAADLTFHNAYAPGHGWCYDPQLAGGGCIIDLGIHLVDLALWTLGFPGVRRVSAHRFHKGTPIAPQDPPAVEDYAVATLELERGTVVRIACSWNLSIGQDALIGATFHGSTGSAVFRNVNGSFYDFCADVQRGAARETCITPPDDWGGRAITEWAERVRAGVGFDEDIVALADVAAVLDRMLGR